MVLSTLIMDHAILYVCHKEAIEVTLNFSCGPTELPSSSFSPLSPPALRVVCLWPWEGLAQSAARLSHGGVLRENADLLSSLTLCLSFFSLSFFSTKFSVLLMLPFFLPCCLPQSLIDCNNRNNDNNGDGGRDGDVKKHNITITNTLCSQWPWTDLCDSERVCVCLCVCEGEESMVAGMLYIRSLPLQFKQSRLCWQSALPSPNGLHHV